MGRPMVRSRRIWPTKGLGALSPHIAGPLAQPLVHATRCAILTGVVTFFLSFFRKFKSPTDVKHNETADKAARAVVDGEALPDITFEEADPKPYQQTGTHQKTPQPQSRHKKRAQAHQQNSGHKGSLR